MSRKHMVNGALGGVWRTNSGHDKVVSINRNGRQLVSALCIFVACLVGSGIATAVAPALAAGSDAAQPGATVVGADKSWAIEAPTRARISAMSVRAGDRATTIIVRADRAIEASVFELLSPPRIVIDTPAVTFDMDRAPQRFSDPLVKAVRFGEVGPGQARIVFELNQRVDFERQMVKQPEGLYELQLNVRPRLRRTQSTARTANLTGVAMPSGAALRRPQPRDVLNPIIVIDPGHGGVDPGAVTPSGLTEKSIVLAVSKRVAARLARLQRFRVILTRSDDTFVPLDRRVQISEEAGAHLFISLHADALADSRQAAVVRGATVYTVSERASDAVAAALAEKENAADTHGASLMPSTPEARAVRTILFDLIQREATDRAARFRERLIGQLRQRIALSRSPRRSAAFRVLRQVRTPSVLVELGYMSNAQDQKLMQTADWQENVATGIVEAIAAQFPNR